jgi:hypothetical protein
MKAEDCSKEKNDNYQPESSEKLIGRREALNKAGMYALSAATMMVLMKSQPAQAQSPYTVPIKNVESTTQTGTWKRTQR